MVNTKKTKTINYEDIEQLYIEFCTPEYLQNLPPKLKILSIKRLTISSIYELSKLNLPYNLEKLYLSSVKLTDTYFLESDEVMQEIKLPFNCEYINYISFKDKFGKGKDEKDFIQLIKHNSDFKYFKVRTLKNNSKDNDYYFPIFHNPIKILQAIVY